MPAKKTTRKIIVTGGAGYIGSHVVMALLKAGDDILIIDNFQNSHPEAVRRIGALTGREAALLERDLADPAHKADIIDAVRAFSADGAVHLAGLKAVGESVAEPARYYRNNIGATLTLIEALDAADTKTIVFSSSATVYGERNENPVTEAGALEPVNPYGRTKLFIEQILKDLACADPAWRVMNLRYFNPVGAHPSGRIGEDPQGIPNNLFPFIAQVAAGRLEKLKVFGNDYPTRDGSGVRDYIHVTDLARGHVAALDYLARTEAGALDVNLGTGRGYSVLEAIEAFQRVSGRDIPFVIAPRRDGDVAEIYADASLAERLLDWRAKKTLENMCADHWRWQSQNPEGYQST